MNLKQYKNLLSTKGWKPKLNCMEVNFLTHKKYAIATFEDHEGFQIKMSWDNWEKILKSRRQDSLP